MANLCVLPLQSFKDFSNASDLTEAALRALNRVEGGFAFCIFDSFNNHMWAARDPEGELAAGGGRRAAVQLPPHLLLPSSPDHSTRGGFCIASRTPPPAAAAGVRGCGCFKCRRPGTVLGGHGGWPAAVRHQPREVG